MTRSLIKKSRVLAQRGLQYPTPRYSEFTYQFMRFTSPYYLRFMEGIRRVEAEGMKHLIAAYQQFYGHQAKLLIAFRHGAAEDPPVMTHLLSRTLPAVARSRGQQLGGKAHAHFVYGRSVLLWAGRVANWGLPRLGGLPIINRKPETLAIRTLRSHLTQGAFPIAFAPEGQVTYHQHRLGPLEQGTARLAMWCAQDIVKKGCAEQQVLMLPVAIHYRFPEQQRTLLRVIARIQRAAGLPPTDAGSQHQQLLQLTEQLIGKIEDYYQQFFNFGKNDSADLQTRIQDLCRGICQAGEATIHSSSGGDILTRVFSMRFQGWERIFRDDFHENPAPLDRNMANFVADQAYLALRHMELVDILEYLQPDYIGPSSEPNTLLEYALNLLDIINRMLGGTIGSRYKVPGKTAIVKIGTPIKVMDYMNLADVKKAEKTRLLTQQLRQDLKQLSQPNTSLQKKQS